jgi:hypothetical protein
MQDMYRLGPWKWLVIVGLGVIVFSIVLRWRADNALLDILLASGASLVVIVLGLIVGVEIRKRLE